jgi:hypothetical protein
MGGRTTHFVDPLYVVFHRGYLYHALWDQLRSFFSCPSFLHPAALWQVPMRTSIPARARGIVVFVIAERRQKRIKTCIESFPLVYRLKTRLKGLPQFLACRMHSSSPLLL